MCKHKIINSDNISNNFVLFFACCMRPFSVFQMHIRLKDLRFIIQKYESKFYQLVPIIDIGTNNRTKDGRYILSPMIVEHYLYL